MKGINGPWRVGTHDGYVTDEGQPIAVIDANDEFVACNTTFYPTELNPDHARLIAAAPELLEALEGLIEAAETGSERSSPYGYFDENIAAARAAIKKAKGE